MTGAYNASKFALEALADSMRIELRPWGVRTILVEPGSIDTGIWRGVLDTIDETEADMRPEHRELYAAHSAGMRKAATIIRKHASPAEKVAAAIERAVTDPRPKPRYAVGLDSRAQLLMRTVLPTRTDAGVRRRPGARMRLEVAVQRGLVTVERRRAE